MRSKALAAAIGSIAVGACAGRPPSPAFASPTFLPDARSARASDPMPPEEEEVPLDPPAAPRAPRIREVTAQPIRAVSAADAASRPGKGAKPSASPARSAPSGTSGTSSTSSTSSTPARSSASSASASSASPPCDDELPKLRMPHRGTEPPPKLRTPDDLRALVGRRETRAPLATVAAWSRELGAPFTATSGAALVSWAAEAGRLRPADIAPRPGDLLVFDQATSDDPSDLVALVLDSDDRGVTEFLYVAAGIVRRGLVDASRPALRRDANGATVNTFLRHGKRWPGKGMHYLAGELLGHVIRMR